jgi:hypothetical protein
LALGISLASLAETFTGGTEGHLVNLTVALDDVDGITVPVCKGSNAFGTGISTHLGGAPLERFNEGDSLIGSHVETFGE